MLSTILLLLLSLLLLLVLSSVTLRSLVRAAKLRKVRVKANLSSRGKIHFS